MTKKEKKEIVTTYFNNGDNYQKDYILDYIISMLTKKQIESIFIDLQEHGNKIQFDDAINWIMGEWKE